MSDGVECSEKDDEIKDDDIKIINIVEEGWLTRTMGDLSRATVAKQITIGGVSGWCAGYVFIKVGKVAASALGGSLLILQIARYKGYININWGQVQKDINKAKKTIEGNSVKIVPYMINEVRDFIFANMFVVGGFAGGFLLGLAS